MARPELQEVKDKFQIAQDAQERFNEYGPTFEQCFRNYIQDPTRRPKKILKNNMSVPLTFQMVELYSSTIYSVPPVLNISRVHMGTLQNAEASRTAGQHWMSHAVMRQLLKQITKAAGIYGTAIVKNHFVDQRRNVLQSFTYFDPTTGQQMEVEYEEQLLHRYGPSSRLLDVRNFLIDPKCTGMHDAEWALEKRYMRPLSAQRYLNSLGVRKSLDTLKGMNSHPATSLMEQYFPGNMHTDSRDVHVEIWEYWDVYGNLVVVLNRDEIVYSGSSPFRHGALPYSSYRIHVPPNMFYGLGLARPIYSLDEDARIGRSQRRDNLDLLLNKPIGVRANSPAWKHPWTWAPKAKIPFDNPDDIYDFQLVDFTGKTIEEEAMLYRDAQNALGLTDYTMGANMPGMNKTAGGAVTMFRASRARLDADMGNFESECLQRMADQNHQNAKQFWASDIPIHVRDTRSYPQDIVIMPEQLQCTVDFDIEPWSTSTLTQDMRRESLMAFIPLALTETTLAGLEAEGKRLSVSKLIGGVAENLGLNEHGSVIEEIPQEELQQKAEMQQLMAMQAAQQAVGGVNG